MEKNTNYIIKRFNNKKEKPNFYFLRWLSEVNKDQKVTNYVCHMIANYMSSKNSILPFLDIFVVDDNVFVYTQCPGKWIGEKGCVTDELKRMLNYNSNGELVHDFKLRIIEPDNTNYNCVMNFYEQIKKR